MLRADEIQAYSDHGANKTLLTELTTLSPEPDITLDMAKELLSKLKEQYDLDEIGIEYVDKERMDFYPSLYWYDYNTNVYSKNHGPANSYGFHLILPKCSVQKTDTMRISMLPDM